MSYHAHFEAVADNPNCGLTVAVGQYEQPVVEQPVVVKLHDVVDVESSVDDGLLDYLQPPVVVNEFVAASVVDSMFGVVYYVTVVLLLQPLRLVAVVRKLRCHA